MKKTISSFLGDQFSKVPPVANADLKGKTVVVVGANTGLGFESTKHFARMGAGRLILACRNQEKGQAALQRLKEETGYSKAELWLVDLAEFASVKAFADRALKDLERLDILLLNAAIASSTSPQYTATADGWEQLLQVNSLSSSLLALLLLPRLIETAEREHTAPRVVVVTSEMHYWTKIEDQVLDSQNAFDVLGSKEYCTPKVLKSRYADSKLLNIFFARALSNRLRSDQSVIVNTVNPGFCYSEIRRNMRSLFMWVFEKLVARQTEEGSRQLVWAAVGTPEGGGASSDKLKGAYINLARVEEPGDFIVDAGGKKREEKLWTDLISVLGKVDARVGEVVSRHLTAA